LDGLAPSLCGMSSPPKAIGARRAARTAAAQQSGGTGTVSGVGDEAPGALFLQGKELEAKGELKAALDKYTRAAKTAVDGHLLQDAHDGRARCMMALGDLDGAMAAANGSLGPGAAPAPKGSAGGRKKTVASLNEHSTLPDTAPQ